MLFTVIVLVLCLAVGFDLPRLVKMDRWCAFGGAAVDLRRLHLGIRRPPAEAGERIHGEAGDDDEDRGRDGEDEERQIAYRQRRNGDRREDVRRLDYVLHVDLKEQGTSQR